MRKTIIIRLLLLSLLSTIFVKPVFSEPIWSWEFQEPTQTVFPTDNVIFWATLFNDPISTEVIYGASNRFQGYWVQGASGGNTALTDQYTLLNPGVGGDVNVSPNFSEQFVDLVLNPGESFDFIFLNLTPKDGSADIGTYQFSASLNLASIFSNPSFISRFSDEGPAVIVQSVPDPDPPTDPPPSDPIPEPTTFLLLGIGLVGLAGAEVRRRRKKKAVS